MKKTRKELEMKLEAQSKQIIQELLDWNESHNEPDLTQIEDIVLELREKLSKAMVEGIVESQDAVQPAELRCPKCGAAMRFKGRKAKVVESRVGEVDLERGHYYCPTCQSGVFPPGSTTPSE
jgi:Zn finger protein HypA/HybF involved in hydrogenase expression